MLQITGIGIGLLMNPFIPVSSAWADPTCPYCSPTQQNYSTEAELREMIAEFEYVTRMMGDRTRGYQSQAIHVDPLPVFDHYRRPLVSPDSFYPRRDVYIPYSISSHAPAWYTGDSAPNFSQMNPYFQPSTDSTYAFSYYRQSFWNPQYNSWNYQRPNSIF
jgi:hypothetical protein